MALLDLLTYSHRAPVASDATLVESIRGKKEEEEEARNERAKRRRRVMMQQYTVMSELESKRRDQLVVSKLARTSVQERRTVVQLLHVYNEKEIIKQHRFVSQLIMYLC